eukprot:s1156_g44.t1
MYAFDCEKAQYVYGNLGYNGLKLSLKNQQAEAKPEWQENEANRGNLGFEELARYATSDYCALKRELDLESSDWKSLQSDSDSSLRSTCSGTISLVGLPSLSATTARSIGSCRSEEPRQVVHEAGTSGWPDFASASGNGCPFCIQLRVVQSNICRPAVCIWITVLGNAVLPNIKRTKDEIRTGKVRQYKARMCLVSYEDPATFAVLRVDDQVLIWYRHRFYRANHFAASYAQVPIGDRFEVLSEAAQTFVSLSITKEDVYNDLLGYVDNHLRPMTEATSSQGGSRALPSTRQQNPDVTKTSRPGYGRHQGSRHSYSQEEWNASYAQWTDAEWEARRQRRQGHQYRERGHFPGYR